MHNEAHTASDTMLQILVGRLAVFNKLNKTPTQSSIPYRLLGIIYHTTQAIRIRF